MAEQERALVFLDECHATGFLGNTGRYEKGDNLAKLFGAKICWQKYKVLKRNFYANRV